MAWAWDGGDTVWAPQYGHDLSEAAQAAADLAARVWGSRRCWFLWNGATAGVLAMVLASVRPGGRLVLPRSVHRSVLDALVFADAEPVFLPSRWLGGWELPLPPAAADVPAGPFDGALVTSPTYEGICPDLFALAQAAGPAPLLVDEAHGTHLAFYPAPAPPTALRSGAHLVVHGAHKTLPVLTQAAMLHWMGTASEPDAERVARFVAMVQSTSPQPALLCSLDAARVEMEAHGAERVGRAVELARAARRALEKSGPYRCLLPADLPAPFVMDETRLVVSTRSLGLAGWQAKRLLEERWNVWPEMAGMWHLVFIFTGADDAQSVQALALALAELARDAAAGVVGHDGAAGLGAGVQAGAMPAPGPRVMRPRQAALGRARKVPWEQAAGAVSAATVTPYPPGTPLLIPGEMITSEAAEYARTVLALGASIRGCPDHGRNVWVMDER